MKPISPAANATPANKGEAAGRSPRPAAFHMPFKPTPRWLLEDEGLVPPSSRRRPPRRFRFWRHPYFVAFLLALIINGSLLLVLFLSRST